MRVTALRLCARCGKPKNGYVIQGDSHSYCKQCAMLLALPVESMATELPLSCGCRKRRDDGTWLCCPYHEAVNAAEDQALSENSATPTDSYPSVTDTP